MKEHKLDLKHSLWTSSEGEFPDSVCYPMMQAFEGAGEPIKVITEPSKHFRHGTVEIYEGGADVEFYYEWDEPCARVDEVGEQLDIVHPALDDDEVEFVADKIATFYSENTWCIAREVHAKTFEELLQGIDDIESYLIESEAHAEKAFHQWITVIVELVKHRRTSQDVQGSAQNSPLAKLLRYEGDQPQ